MSVEKKYFIVELTYFYNTKHVRFEVLFPLQISVILSIFNDFSMLCLLDIPTQCEHEFNIIILSDLIWTQLAILAIFSTWSVILLA